MSSRDISGTMLRVCFGAVRKETTLAKVLTDITEQIAFVQRDLDICGDMDDAYYYMGMIDALEMVAYWIAPLKEARKKEFLDLIDKTSSPTSAELAGLMTKSAAKEIAA
jgi:hypothetical protein